MRSDDVMTEIYQMLNSASSVKSLYQTFTEKRLEMGLSDLQVSKILKIDKSTFARLLQKLEQGLVDKVDFYSVLKLCQLLGIGIEEMSQLYVASLTPEYVAGLEAARKARFLVNNFDLKGLKDVGFIQNAQDFDQIEERITSFFGLETIFQWRSEVGAVAFSRTKNVSHDKMREFWVRAAIFQFEKTANPNDYTQEKLLAIIPKMAPYTRYEEKGFRTVLQALYNVGITVIVQSYLTKTQVRGGTFIVNDKPCIVITNYNKTYAGIWFALMHELYHVLYDFEQLKSLRYHLTGEPQSDLYLFREDMADFFGCEMLFPQEKMEFIKHTINSPGYVVAYAAKNNIHPSIIYSFFCYEQKARHNKDFYPGFQKFFGKSDKALDTVISNPWNKKTVFEGIEKIKASLQTQPTK